MNTRFYYTDRKGELQEIGCDFAHVLPSGALVFGYGHPEEPEATELIVAPGDWHDLTNDDSPVDGLVDVVKSTFAATAVEQQ